MNHPTHDQTAAEQLTKACRLKHQSERRMYVAGFLCEDCLAAALRAERDQERAHWLQYAEQRMIAGGNPVDEYEQGMQAEARLFATAIQSRGGER